MSPKLRRELVRYNTGPVLEEETLPGNSLYFFVTAYLSSFPLHYQQLVQALSVTLQHVGFYLAMKRQDCSVQARSRSAARWAVFTHRKEPSRAVTK